MSSSDFHQITIRGDAQKAERLFRAAVSAFCSLPRPSRREIAQLEDLALPLFEHVSVESKRYVAAALSECAYPPAALVRRLCDESVDIAAPLLIRSAALTDIDLIALIGRHGYRHARAIGRRRDLNPTIARLVATLESKVVPLRQPGRETPAPAAAPAEAPSRQAAPAQAAPVRAPGAAADDVRRQLRAMMQPASPLLSTGRTPYDRLRDTALSGHPAFFQTALADALDIEFAAVRHKADDSQAWLLDALRMLDITDEKAFLVTAAIFPSSFGDLESIRRFLSRYAAIDAEGARQRIAGWQAGRRAADASLAGTATGETGSDAAPPLRLNLGR